MSVSVFVNACKVQLYNLDDKGDNHTLCEYVPVRPVYACQCERVKNELEKDYFNGCTGK